MSREIRRVPPDWDHPRYTADDAPYPNWVGAYIPLYDQDYTSAAQQWIADFLRWHAGTFVSGYGTTQESLMQEGTLYFWEWDTPPDPEVYRTRAWTPEEATAYQVYQTVSEGTPVSPVLLTEADLRAWLIAEWDLSPEGADHFIKSSWVPSEMTIVRSDGPGTFTRAEQIPDLLAHSTG